MMRLAATVFLFAVGCRDSPREMASTSSSSSSSASKATSGVSPLDASVRENEGAGASPPHEEQRGVEPEIGRKRWLVLQALQFEGKGAIFDVEEDGRVFYSDEGSVGEHLVLWQGHVEPAVVKKVEDIFRKNNFCSLKTLERKYGVKREGLSIGMRGFDCASPDAGLYPSQRVAAQYPAWRKAPRAKAVYLAVRELMDATCGAKCPPPPQLQHLE